MPKIKYVGLKKGPTGETAFKHDTNITWFPGTVKEVAQAIAGRMLNHPDVFALAGDAEPENDGDATPPAQELAPVAQKPAIDPPDDDEANLTPAQRRMQQFAAGDTGDENEHALGAGEGSPADPSLSEAGAAAAATGDTSVANAMTLAPGATVKPAVDANAGNPAAFTQVASVGTQPAAKASKAKK